MYYQNMMAIIARPKLEGAGEHFGIYLGDGNVAHNTKDRGAHFVSLAEFHQDKKARVVQDLSNHNRTQIYWRVMDEISASRPYNLVSNNCENFANRVVGNKPESPQINMVILATAFLALFALNR